MKGKFKWMVVLALALSLAVALPAASLAGKKPIKIGVVLPLSGGFEI